MDANGARALRSRIEQLEHWRLADAVRKGLQPANDPDAADLETISDGVRVYRAQRALGVTAARPQRLVKRLVKERWEASLVDAEDTAA